MNTIKTAEQYFFECKMRGLSTIEYMEMYAEYYHKAKMKIISKEYKALLKFKEVNNL